MTAVHSVHVALLASRVRFEEKRILEALERRRISCERLDTRAFRQEIDAPAAPWSLVLNREISATDALYAAMALEARGALVMNSAAAIETCADKWRTSVVLRGNGLPTPRTALALTARTALAAAEEMGYPVVLKPLTGSWGRRVALLKDAETAGSFFEYCEAMPSPRGRMIYLQKYVQNPGRDIRVIVVGGRALGAVYRRSEEWRTNVARGATGEPCRLTDDLARVARGAAAATGAAIAGVDVMEDTGGGLHVIEVNHGVEFAGFQQVLHERVDVAEEIVRQLILEARR